MTTKPIRLAFASRCAAIIALGWALGGCGAAAQQLGKGAAEGAVEGVGRKVAERAEERGRPDPGGPTEILLRALTTPLPKDERTGRAAHGTPVEIVASQAANAIGRELSRQLDQRDEGTLGASTTALVEDAASSVTRTMGTEALGSLGCDLATDQQCLERRIADLSRAASRGTVEGIGEAAGPWLLAGAFVAGAVVALVFALAFSHAASAHRH